MERIIKKISSLRTVSIALIIFWAITFVLFCFHTYYSDYIVSSTGQKLLGRVKENVEKIVSYIDEHEQKLSELAADQQIIDSFTQANVDDKKIQSFIARHKKDFLFKNILLIDPDGSTRVAFEQPEKFKVNLTQPPYKDTNLGLAFEQTRITLTSTISSYAYDYILGKPSLYIIEPVFYEQKLIGFIAAQVNHNTLFEITHNYFGLGKFGEVVIAKLVGNQFQVIGEMRNRPQATFGFVEYMKAIADIPIQRAVLGEEGLTVEADYRGITTINARSYIPILGWGLVIKMDLNEVVAPLEILASLMFIFFVLSIILSIIFIFFMRTHIVSFLNLFIGTRVLSVFTTRNVVCVCLALITSLYLVNLFIEYKRLQSNAFLKGIDTVHAKEQDVSQYIIQELDEVMFLAQGIADDLQFGRLSKEDIIIRMERDLKENPSLFGLTIAYAPYAHSKSKKLFAPHIIKQNGTLKQQMLEEEYDYTISGEKQLYDWYSEPMKTGAMWFRPSSDNFGKTEVVRYVVPFYESDKKPIGVIVAEYDMNRIREIMQNLVMGKTGYSFLLSRTGRFIVHPIQSYVDDQKTIVDLAQLQANKEFFALAHKIVQEKTGNVSYYDPKMGGTIWIHFSSIPITNWKLAAVFTENEFTIQPVVARQMFIKMIISLVVLLLVLSIFFCNVYYLYIPSLIRYAFVSSIILFAGLLGTLFVVKRTVQNISEQNGVVISTETSLKAYLGEQQRKAESIYQSLQTVPTGMYLYSLSFPAVDLVTFSGYIWQTYNTNQSDIPHDFRILNATQVETKRVFYEKGANFETIGWNVNATIRQLYNYSQYPFDQRQVVIQLAPKGIHSNILLIPALSDYTKAVENFLGIPKEFKLAEYNIKETFFSFVTKPREITFGVSLDRELLSETNLAFNLVLDRDILNALIVYLVPILVILFSLYAIFFKLSGMTLDKNLVYRAIGFYSGLLFALIVLHNNLRSQYPAGGFLYIEYLFFLTYLTIFLFIIQMLVIPRSKKLQEMFVHISFLLKIFFWPIQFACWLLATVSAFY